MEQCSGVVTGPLKASFRETAVGLDDLATHVGTRWWETMQTAQFHDEEGSPEVARVKKKVFFFLNAKSAQSPENFKRLKIQRH